ncbi:hypothetical protein KPL71_021156 [Citrus sinensis]|uniref:Uncharacterized protein n=1 Tax=Citrus sinensis TaxID=2711 RepID=A0ACB8JFK8_CITSI|nr:hypothetical protein KPL71_021156 [Citrus sinensis]
MAPSSSLRQFAVDFVKLERFDGGNFIRWQKKLHFLLTSLNVVYVLTTPKPQERENETLAETRVRHKWEQDDYVCKGHICNAMSDTLFDQYHNKPTSKEIWDSLEAKYMMEDATNDNAWWIDSGATKHVCKDRSLFKSYKAMDDGSVLYMENSSTAIVKGKGNVQLEFTSGKTLTLTDVYHVPEVRKNLVSGSLLNKFGFKLVFESNKFILSKGGTFVGKGYMYEGMFKLNINNMNVSSAYMVDSLSLWHNRLGHVNIRRLHDMANLELIPKHENDMHEKCKGCRAIVRLPEPKIKKLGERGIEGIFLGYAEHSKAYRFLVTEPNSFVEINTIVESRDAIFYENRFSTIPKSIDSQENDKQIEIGQKRDANNEQNHLRRSKRIRTIKSFGPDFIVYLVEGTRDSQSKQTMITPIIESDPLTYEEVMKSQDAAFWKEVINDEMDSIVGNKTWKLVDLPHGSNPIGCKWIFKKKKKVDGTIERFKARLVAKGFTQKEGLDYFDTYAHVARIATIRVLIALASIYQFEIHQMNVKTTFLNGELDEEIYMKQPEGFNGNKGVIICLYVDDMLIFGTDSESIKLTKSLLSSNFDMKDMGLADVILGIKIIKNENGLVLTQSHYIEKILKKFNYYDCKSVSTPFDSNIRLYPNTGRSVSQLEYARIIGCFMYAMTCTRPDIAFVVGKLSRYTSNPSQAHWQAVYRILKYLKHIMDYGIYYTGYPSVLEGFSDASWITDRDDHTSTSGWIFNLGGGVISWGSKKQTCIADSTMAAKFVALALGCKKAKWLRNLLIEIPIWPKPMPHVSIHCDSEATLSRAYSQIYNGKSRHIGLIHNYVRQLLTDGVITIDFVKSCQNLADPLTKALARDIVFKTSKGMGLKPASSYHQ